MGIGDLYCQFFYQFFDRFVDGTGVSELGENDEADVMEWLIANHRIFELLDETGGYTLHLIAMTRVGVIGLTAGSVVEQESSLRNSLTASSAYFQRLRSLLDVFSISLFSV